MKNAPDSILGNPIAVSHLPTSNSEISCWVICVWIQNRGLHTFPSPFVVPFSQLQSHFLKSMHSIWLTLCIFIHF